MARWLALALLASLVAPVAGAVDVTFGAEGEAGWDSNVVSFEDGPSSWVGKIGPTVKLEEPQGDLTYTLSYRARYDAYYDLHQLDGWEHYANLNGTYRLGATTTIRFGNLFQFLPVGSTQFESINAINGQPVPGQVISVFGQNRFLLNSASATLTHSFSPLWLTELELSNSYYDPRGEGQVASVTTVGQTSLIYQLERTDRLGLGVGVTGQQFLATNNRPSSHTEYYNVYGLWRHDFSPTLNLSVQAGPTFVDAGTQDVTGDVEVPAIAQTLDNGGRSGLTAFYSSCNDVGGVARFDTCRADQSIAALSPTPEIAAFLQRANNRVPARADFSGGGVDVTYFANISLTQEWETVTASLRYSRSASNQGGLSTSSVLDSVTGIVTWRPAELWSIVLTGIWTQRESVNEGIDPDLSKSLFVQPVDLTVYGIPEPVTASEAVVFSSRKVNIQTYLVSLRVDRRIWKRLTVYGSFSYVYQNQGDTFGTANSNYDATRINLGLRYEFDPIQLF